MREEGFGVRPENTTVRSTLRSINCWRLQEKNRCCARSADTATSPSPQREALTLSRAPFRRKSRESAVCSADPGDRVSYEPK